MLYEHPKFNLKKKRAKIGLVRKTEPVDSQPDPERPDSLQPDSAARMPTPDSDDRSKENRKELLKISIWKKGTFPQNAKWRKLVPIA